MSIFIIGFLIGVTIVFHLPTLLNLLLLATLLCIAGMVFIFWRNKFYCCLLGIILGLFYATFFGNYFSPAFIPHTLENKKLTILGAISNIPQKKDHYQSFQFITKQLTGKKESIQLAWNNQDVHLKPGQIWRLVVKLKRPHTLANPGSFDAEQFYFEHEIAAKGYVINSKQNQLLGNNFLITPINVIRNYIRSRLLKSLPNDIHSAVFIPAFTIGDQELISNEDWAILQTTGTNHLVAIAGLHIGLLCSLVFFLTKIIWRRFPYLILIIPVNCAAALASIFVAIIYSGLAGFSLPTQRALIMLSTFMLGIFLRKRIPAWHSYWLAIFLILLIHPSSVLSASFWLSFSAVASIIWMLSYRRGNFSLWRQHFNLQVAVSLGVLPCTIFFFHNASIISPIANAIVVPWVGFIVVPFSLLGTFISLFNLSLAHSILLLASYSMQIAWWFLQQLSHIPYSALSLVLNKPVCLLWLGCTIFLLIFPRGLSIRYLSGLFLMPILFQTHTEIPQQTIKLTVLEVGQGLSCIIQTAHHALIYDAGPAQPDGFNTGRDVIYPYMQYANLNFFDTMIISHGDNDHSGGAFYLLDHYLVGSIYTNATKLFHAYSLPVQTCEESHHWNWDDVNFDLFANTTNYTSKNNMSCILRISINQHAILLPGDIEKVREQDLANHEPTLLSADILLAPHHGSNTSSSPKFVELTHPKYVIYSTGYLNHFHFPSNLVQARYQTAGARELNTPQSGMIKMLMDKEGTISSFSERNNLYEWWRMR